MILSSLQKISACESATCLLDQPSIAECSKRFGHVVPRHSKKYHFASCCLFLGGSHCSRIKLFDNFSEAVGASAIAKLYLMARLQCPSCERLCESSCSNGSDFHALSFLNRAFQ